MLHCIRRQESAPAQLLYRKQTLLITTPSMIVMLEFVFNIHSCLLCEAVSCNQNDLVSDLCETLDLS